MKTILLERFDNNMKRLQYLMYAPMITEGLNSVIIGRRAVRYHNVAILNSLKNSSRVFTGTSTDLKQVYYMEVFIYLCQNDLILIVNFEL